MYRNYRIDENALNEKINIMEVGGCEGPSIYVNNYRVSGPKPWGGGKIIREFETTKKELLYSIFGEKFEESEV